MKKNFLKLLCAGGLALHALAALASPKEFSFGVVARPYQSGLRGDASMRDAIAQADARTLAFVVANGIKTAAEPCSDTIYNRRKALLNGARHGLVVSLAASDWTECKYTNGKPAAMGRLNRLRDLFFADEFSLGDSRIALIRQSTVAKFRSYGENARWEFGAVMFATINLPADNNHYLTEAGRNSEFEDRMMANRDWLHRVFTYAMRNKAGAVVLFSDANPIATASRTSGKRDGFAETRQQLLALAAKFPGKVLLVHGRTARKPRSSAGISWQRNIGTLEVAESWIRLDVDPATPNFIAVHDANEGTDGDSHQGPMKDANER